MLVLTTGRCQQNVQQVKNLWIQLSQLGYTTTCVGCTVGHSPGTLDAQDPILAGAVGKTFRVPRKLTAHLRASIFPVFA